ncbi:MAG TPA: DUF4266 domain-containing protein [Candidatus Acidoferrum sp.]|nr:DUF4266 domain-containing protein [Candidatus Acidoferrum sp.]
MKNDQEPFPGPKPHSNTPGVITRGIALALFGIAGVFATGCKHVSPWERGALADPTMRADANPLGNSMAEHMWFSREAASGGRGVGGGGCGCN